MRRCLNTAQPTSQTFETLAHKRIGAIGPLGAHLRNGEIIVNHTEY